MGGLSKLPYCTGRWGVIFFAYFGEISRFAYDDLPDGKQLAVLEAHRHKRECSLCSDAYTSFKAQASESLPDDEKIREYFSTKAFKLARENEQYLDSLLDGE